MRQQAVPRLKQPWERPCRSLGPVSVADKRGEDAQAFQKDPPAAWVIGTLYEAAHQLAALRDAGVDRVMCQHLLHDLQAVALLGDELAPRVS